MAEPLVTVDVMNEEEMKQMMNGGPSTDVGLILEVIAKVWAEKTTPNLGCTWNVFGIEIKFLDL